MNDLSEEILNAIKYALDKKQINCDRTYKTVITAITPKGYVILDDTGNERTVQCCIPNVSLIVGQKVWVKEPLGNLRGLHICGVAQ